MEIFFLSAVEDVSPLTGEYFLRPLCMEFPVGEIIFGGDDFICRKSGEEFGMLRLILAFPG